MKKKSIKTEWIEKPFTPTISLHHYTLCALKDRTKEIFGSTGFLGRRLFSVQECLEYVRAIARAESELWHAVYAIYPEAKVSKEVETCGAGNLVRYKIDNPTPND